MLSLTRARTLLVLVFALALSIAFILHGEVSTPYVNTNYVEPPPAEATTYTVNLSEICTLCLNCSCSTYAGVNVYAYAFKPSNYVIGLLTSLNGAWVGECWSPSVPTSPGPFNLSISQCQLPSSYDHVGIPLYYYPTGGSVWIQSVDIYGLGQYCTLAAIPPKISNVTIAKNSGVTNVPGYEFSVYIDSPGTENYVTLTIYYGSMVVYQVYKYVQLPSQWASCTTLRVDFGPIQPLVCGTYTIVATESTPGGSQSQYTTTLNVPCPYTTITLIVDSGGSVVVSGNASGTYTGPTTTTINVIVGSEVTFTAAPGSGYVFSQWLVNGSSISANPITLTINGPTTIEAVFRQVGYYVYVTVTNDSLGAGWLITSSVASVGGSGNVFNTQLRIGGPTDTITASITGNPSGYTCRISPTSVNAQAGNTYTFTINCISIAPSPSPSPPPSPPSSPSPSPNPSPSPLPSQSPQLSPSQSPSPTPPWLTILLITVIALLAVVLAVLIVVILRLRR